MANRLDTELLITAGVNGLSHIDNLITTIGQAGGNTDQLREAAEQLRAEWDSLSADEQADRLRNLGNAANQGADDVGLLEQQTEDTTSAFDRMKTGLLALAAALGLAFIIGKIKSFFTDAIEGAAEFEQQLATIQAVSSATVEQMDRIKVASEELGKSTRYNATEAAEGFEILARAGLSVDESLKTISSVLALAQGNSLELADAAGYVTNAVQGMGLEFADAGRVTDVMAKAAASANTDVAGMGEALSYAAPSAAALGLSLENTAAYIGKFADAGIDASRAGTALNGMLSQFGNSTSAFRRELANAGITTGDFNEAIAQLAAAGSKGQVAINALGMEAGPALKALLGQGIPALDELKAKLYDAGGTAQQQADVMNDTWQGALDGLGSSWDYLKDKLGESFLAPMTESFKSLGDMIVSLVDSGKIGQLGDSLARVFKEATTAVIDYISKMDFATVIDKVSTSLDTLRGIGAGINGAFQALSITFQVLKSGVLAIGIAVSMVVTLFAEMWKVVVDGGGAIAKALGLSVPVIDKVSNALGGALQAAEDFRGYADEEMAKSSESITKSFESIAGGADGTANSMIDVGNQVKDTFVGIVDDAFLADQGTEEALQGIRKNTAEMIDGFDTPDKFAELLKAIVDTGNEANVGAEIMNRLMIGAGGLAGEHKIVVDKAKESMGELGMTAEAQAEKVNAAINNAFEALSVDVAQSLTGVNSKTQQTFDLIATGAKSVGESSYSAAEKAKLLASLFAEGMNVAKTAEEFKVLNDMVSAHGLTSVVTAEQKKILKIGMEGGTEAVKAAADAEAKQTAELEKNAEAAAKNAEKSRDHADAKNKQAQAADLAADATANATQNESYALAVVQKAVGAIKDKIEVLEKLSGTTGGTDAAFNKLMTSMGFVEGFRWNSLVDFANSMNRANAAIDKQIAGFETAKDRAEQMTQALSGNAVSSRDLAEAQGVLRRATDVSIEGIVRMDEATLDNLKKAIDSTKQKMEDLAEAARNTAQRLEADLAKIRGDDDKALKLEQTKKLLDLENLLADARKRGSAEEIKYYTQALNLQKEINKEERKELNKKASESSNSSASQSAANQPISKPSNSSSNNNGGASGVKAADVVDALDARILAAEKRGAENMARQLMEEAKRRPL